LLDCLFYMNGSLGSQIADNPLDGPCAYLMGMPFAVAGLVLGTLLQLTFNLPAMIGRYLLDYPISWLAPGFTSLYADEGYPDLMHGPFGFVLGFVPLVLQIAIIYAIVYPVALICSVDDAVTSSLSDLLYGQAPPEEVPIQIEQSPIQELGRLSSGKQIGEVKANQVKVLVSFQLRKHFSQFFNHYNHNTIRTLLSEKTLAQLPPLANLVKEANYDGKLKVVSSPFSDFPISSQEANAKAYYHSSLRIVRIADHLKGANLIHTLVFELCNATDLKADYMDVSQFNDRNAFARAVETAEFESSKRKLQTLLELCETESYRNCLNQLGIPASEKSIGRLQSDLNKISLEGQLIYTDKIKEGYKKSHTDLYRDQYDRLKAYENEGKEFSPASLRPHVEYL